MECKCDNQPTDKSRLKPKQKNITNNNTNPRSDRPPGPTPTPASKPTISSITDEQLADMNIKLPFLGNLLSQLKNNATNIDINKVDPNHYHTNALHQAIELGNEDIVGILLTTNIDVNKRDSFEDMPLHLAIQTDNKKIVQALLEKGAIVDQQAINLAENAEIKNLLLKYNQDPNNLQPIIPITREMIQKAASLNILELSQALHILRKTPNSDINFNEHYYIDHFGRNMLHQAVLLGDPKIVQLFLDKNVAINKKDNLSSTPLHYAISKDSLPIVQLLVDHGADINVPDQFGRTPLDLAIFKQSEEMVNILLKK
jgi:ankyrin repeat protein